MPHPGGLVALAAIRHGREVGCRSDQQPSSGTISPHLQIFWRSLKRRCRQRNVHTQVKGGFRATLAAFGGKQCSTPPTFRPCALTEGPACPQRPKRVCTTRACRSAPTPGCGARNGRAATACRARRDRRAGSPGPFPPMASTWDGRPNAPALRQRPLPRCLAGMGESRLGIRMHANAAIERPVGLGQPSHGLPNSARRVAMVMVAWTSSSGHAGQHWAKSSGKSGK